MAFMVSGSDSKTFTPAPEGTHQAVCVDVIDKGWLPNPFKEGTEQHKVDLAWQIGEMRDDGKRFIVFKRYTASLNDKATLRHDLESWRGRPFTAQELAGFDLESVIGANCLLNVVHKTGTKDPSKTFANVAAVMPLIKGMPKLSPVDYERVPPAEEPEPEPEPEREPFSELTDLDIPF
jgi:hypothetical protein